MTAIKEYWQERVRELTRPLVGAKIDKQHTTYQAAIKFMLAWISSIVGREVSDIGQLNQNECIKVINEVHAINARRQKK